MTAKRWTLTILFALAVALVALFVVQNGGRSTDLSLDLYFTAFHFKNPVPVTYLVGGALALGLVLGRVWGLAAAMSTSRELADARRQLARANVAGEHDEWT